jgi:hypothetical protein
VPLFIAAWIILFYINLKRFTNKRSAFYMRKWHRWFSFIFGAFLLFIAITGVLSHVAAMYAQGSVFAQEEKGEGRPPEGRPPEAGAAVAATGSATGAAAIGKPAPAEPQQPNPKRKLVGLLHHLHSGEFFGPIGVIISLLAGLSMIFFSFSGLWIYYQMYVRRRTLSKKELFWD